MTGVVTATQFKGDGSGLTGIVASGSGVIVKDGGSTVGTAGTINFGDNLSVSAISAGIVTITGFSGITTNSGVVSIANDLDVDGHTNLDNVSVSGVTTMSGNLEVEGNTGITIRSANPRLIFTDTDHGPDFSIRGNAGMFRIVSDSHSADRLIVDNQGNFDILQSLDVRKDLDVNGHTNLDNVSIAGVTTFAGNIGGTATFNNIDVDGHTELDNVNIAGVVTATTFKGALEATSASFSSNIDANGDLDVDGHTNLDNVSVAGVSTFSNFIYANLGILIRDDNKSILLGESDDMRIRHTGSHSEITDEGTGDLRLGSNRTVIGNPTFSETCARFIQNGAVELYHDNIKRLETSSVGVSIPQDLDVNGHTNLDNVSVAGVTTTAGTFNAANIVQVGTTNDSGELRIGHDGSSYRARIVSNSSNRLTIDADGPERIQMHGGVIYMRPLNTEKSAAFVANGAVELYYNDVKKFETTSAGADFTVTSGGQVNIFGLGGTNGLRISGPQSASSACLFFNTNHQNVSGGTDQYTIQCGGANHTLMFKHTDTTGNVVFELDDSEHVRIPQDSKALKIGAGQDLQLSHNATDSYVSNNTGHLRIGNTHDSSNIKFFTNNSTRWNIDSNGHFVPDSNNTFNIGNASYTIGDLFLSGNITSSGNFNTTSAAPLQFTNNSNTTSAKKTVIYANYNNTSNHAYNGLLIEMGHVTDSLYGEVRKFTIGERGGHTNAVIDQNGIHYTGGSTNPTLNADNGLNDYEEGTAFTSTGHATVHQAAYTKVGRMVTISFRASVTSGNTQAISLPFVHAGNHGDHILGCIVTAGVFKEIILSSSSSFTLTAGFSKGTLTYPTNT